MKIGSIYLAAGSSKRMGEAKLSLELAPGITMGSRGLQELRSCGFHPLTVVVRPDDPLLWLYDRKERIGLLPKYRITPCKEAQCGMSHSIRSGIQGLLPENPDAVLIALADQPFVNATLLKRLVSVYQEDPTVDYVASGYGDVAGPPVIFNKSMFPQLCELEGDAGARKLLKSPKYRGRVVRYAAEWAFIDVDTKDQLEKARLIWSQMQSKAK
ncbi:nucleotidyltransferase family protein [Paenibacillus lignilyticus]|uniref:Nucleotidyltransferase family protein n=1 Tax=Paenibacillus lignilyticus TaxID=1172615 RepID=A0ABS5CBG7_9BACL|nr:nucleotidyltransferase family protein [Paenibacillus lignilyticus]MBP3963336.1 nucleotidyltransferase family protein [Paenibacillus lignilyticus]